MNFGLVKTTLLALVSVVCVALIIIDALLIGGVFGRANGKIVAGVSMAAGFIILGACLLVLFGSYYQLKDHHFVAVLGFFKDKIDYDSVDGIRQNTVTKEVFVGVSDDKGMTVISLNLTGVTADKFASDLAGKCGLLIDYFSPDKTEKK